MEFERISHPNIHEIRVYPDENLTAKGAAEYFANKVQKNPDIPVTFATGDTMIPFAKNFKLTGVDFSRILARHLDQYWQYPNNGEFSFPQFLYDRIFKPLNINRRNIATIDGLAKNPYAEADRYDKLVKNISVCILGVGPGGHLGFTESSNDFDIFTMRTHFQQLSRVTFERDTIERKQDTPPTAITQGLANIGETEERIVILYGPEKGKILADALHNSISPLNPASYLKKEDVGNSTIIFIDKAAAKQVE
ncbi:MAG: 6-phosphogluconolactonase [Patescibacteria group bacterium]